MSQMFDESPDDAWQQRYGETAPPLPELGRFLNHRSVRRYKSDPIPEEVMKGIVAAGQSAATSSNLQLWSIVSVQEPERRERITQLCDNQVQVRTASWFLCFLVDHHRLRQAAARVGESAEGLVFTEFYTMAVIDAALAAERMVCAAESLGIGICYIGALRNDAEGVKQLLELPHGVFGAFGLCFGYPEEPLRASVKPRLKQEAVWFRERYESEVDVAEYDERMRAFYEGQKMKVDVTWSMRSGRRVDLNHMTGRETLLPWLREQGFLRE